MISSYTSRHIPSIDVMKLFLICGVALIHSNVSGYFSDYAYNSNFLIRLCGYISFSVCRVCVPCFFILSGFLFFYGIKDFNLTVYSAKLKGRIFSLLLPYMLWCLICCGLLYIKHRFFQMSGLGIFLDNGGIDWFSALKGFCSIDQNGGYPYAFAFWFIRNLIVFCILSPIAWLIGRYHLLTVILFLVYIVFDIDFYGFQWFVAGCYLSVHSGYLRRKRLFVPELAVMASVIFWTCVLVDINVPSESIQPLFMTMQVAASLYLTLYLSRLIESAELVRKLVPATFIIYATHQCYCTAVGRFFVSISGGADILSPLIAYLGSFLTLIILGFLIYLILHRFSPSILRILSGGH